MPVIATLAYATTTLLASAMTQVAAVSGGGSGRRSGAATHRAPVRRCRTVRGRAGGIEQRRPAKFSQAS